MRSINQPFGFPAFIHHAISAFAVVRVSIWPALLLPLMLAAAAEATPPVITAISPDNLIQNTVPQPTFTVTGTDLVVGVPGPGNQPTVTLQHTSIPRAHYSMIGSANAGGTSITLAPATNSFNLLQAPLGTYNVTVTRPDAQTVTLPAAFSLHLDQATGIHITPVGRWGGPISDIDIVGNLAYVANGRMLRILNIANPANPVEVGNIDLLAVGAVKVRNGYAFVCAQEPYRFSVVDVSNPAQPKLVWNAYGDSAHNAPKDIQLYGNTAYVRCGAGGYINIYDITDPRNVIYLGHDLFNQADSMTIAGDKLYVGAPKIGATNPSLRIYDLTTDPAVPTMLGMVTQPGVNATHTKSISVEGNLACWSRHDTPTGNGTGTMWVVDVSNPQAPTILGSYPEFTQSIGNVCLSGGKAYIAALMNDGMHPPLSYDGVRMYVLNVAANPANPSFMAVYDTHAGLRMMQETREGRSLKVIGNRAYLYDDGEGLIIMDISNPANPVRLGNYHSPPQLRKMAHVPGSNLVYVADSWNGFTVLNVADAAHPTVVGVYQSAHLNNLQINSFGIAYHDNKIYLAAGHHGLEVIDVTNPASPAFLGAYRINDGSPCSLYGGITVSGNYAHVGYIKAPPSCSGTPLGYILKFDISNPASIPPPTSLFLGQQGDPARTFVRNPQGFAFVSYAVGGVCSGGNNTDITIDANSATPTLISTDTTPRCDIPDLALEGNTLYLASPDTTVSRQGVYAQDVSNAASPVQLLHLDQNYPLPNGMKFQSCTTVAVQNHRLYASATHENGFFMTWIFDVTNPASPVFLDRGPFAQAIDHLLVDEPRVYSTSGPESTSATLSQNGFIVYDVLNLPPPPDPADINHDGHVNIDDLVLVITQWGQCPLLPPPSPNPPGAGPGLGVGSGDMNCDNVVNPYDINPFMLALNDYKEYFKTYPACDYFNGDMNNSDFPIDTADLRIFCPLAGGVVSGGQCLIPGPCPADIAPVPGGNRVVDIDDLVLVITHWGH